MQYATTRITRPRQLWLVLPLMWASCTGAVPGSHPDGRSDNAEEPEVKGPFMPSDGDKDKPVPEAAGALVFRRLSKTQYQNTLRDLLGASVPETAALPTDGFANDGYVLPGPVGELEVRRFMDAAESVAAKLDVERVTKCKGGAAEEACMRTFLTAFGRRAFRRPLDAAEVDSWQAHFKNLRGTIGLTFDEAARDVVAAMLQSPHFLYLRQLPDPASTKAQTGDDGLVQLNAHETAARLSYFLWETMPDDELFAAADKDELRTRADVERQARRMLQDERARATVAQFHQMWLGIGGLEDLEKDPAKYPMFDRPLAKAMLDETMAFVEDVFVEDGKFATLLTSRNSSAQGALAQHYGATEPAAGGSVELPEARAGLFTRAAFLAQKALPGESHPVLRGHFLLVHALCATMPSPPDDIPPPRPAAPNLSTRERFAEHGQTACARACHELIDPLGFAFEHFDGVGRYRQSDGGKPVDASGAVELDGVALRFDGAPDLMKQLATNDSARACFAKHWFGFALGRRLTDDDTGSMNVGYAGFARNDFDMRDLLAAVASSKTFRFRKPAAGEVFQ